MLGGPGSWYEVRGQDRRVEMSRVCARRAWIGRASEVAESILSSHAFTPQTQETARVYEEKTGTLNQRGSDLDFIRKLARANKRSFWISYECESGGLNPLAASPDHRNCHFTSSPPRPRARPSTLPQIPLVATTDVVFRVNVDRVAARRFRTSTSIRHGTPTQFNGSAVDVAPCGPRPPRRKTRPDF
jgi:hypothetical protein